MTNLHTASHQERYSSLNSNRTVYVAVGDLPLSCPQRTEAVWRSHPMVFLPILEMPPDENGARHVQCPYCSTEYILPADQA